MLPRFYYRGRLGSNPHTSVGSKIKIMNSDQKIDNEKIEALKKEIETLKSQWPAHSVPAAMLQRLEEIEEELEKELQNNADA